MPSSNVAPVGSRGSQPLFRAAVLGGVLAALAGCSRGLVVPAADTNKVGTGAPTISAFTSTGAVVQGQAGTLSWQVDGATTLSLDNGLGTVTGGSVQVSPAATTTYTLTATNSAGSVTATCALTVYPAGEGAFTVLGTLPAALLIDGTGRNARLSAPMGLALDASGNLRVADPGDLAIRAVTPQGVVTTACANLPAAVTALVVDAAGNVDFPMGSTIQQLSAAGALTVLAGAPGQSGSADGQGAAAQFNNPAGIAADAAGNLFIADTGNNTIRKLDPQGNVTTVAGTAGQTGNVDGAGAAAQFDQPGALAFDPTGNLLVADVGNGTVRALSPTGSVSTFANPGSVAGGLAEGPGGVLYVGGLTAVYQVAVNGTVSPFAGSDAQLGYADGPAASARFAGLGGVAVTAGGVVYLADAGNNVLRAVDTAGNVTTLAGAPGASAKGATGLAVDPAGNAYVLNGNTNSILKIPPQGAAAPYAGVPGKAGSADGAGTAALFGFPAGAAADAAGNLYVTDLVNQTIRKIDKTGTVSTLAGTTGQAGSADGNPGLFNGPTGIAVDAQGTLYVADTGNGTIRKVAPDGTVSTLAGTPGQTGDADGKGAAAQFSQPLGVAVDTQGNVFVADSGNGALRRVAPDGTVTTLSFYLGADNSPGNTLFVAPAGVAVDAAGDVFALDTAGHDILRIAPGGIASWVPVAGDVLSNLQLDCLAVAGGNLYAGAMAGAQAEVVEVGSVY